MRFLFALIAILVLNEAALAQDKLPVPVDDAQKQALTLIANLYKKEHDAAKTSEQKSALAKEMLQVGKDSKDDPTSRYVLFRLARDVAAGAGDTATAMSAIEATASLYEIDVLALQAEMLPKIVKAIRLPKGHQDLAVTIQKVFDAAIAQDRFDLAKAVNIAALESARQSRSADLVKQAVAQSQELQEIEAEYRKVQSAVEKLSTAPTDPEANLLVGQYRCFIKADWDSGLLVLALGNNAQLKTLAMNELSEKPDALMLGDGWWTASNEMSGRSKTQVQEHAKGWYQKALPGLSGLAKVRVERLLGQSSQNTVDTVKTASSSNSRSLLKGFDPNGKIELGRWAMTKSSLMGDASGGVAKIQIGDVTSPNYDLNATFVVHKRSDNGFGDVIVGLPSVGAPMCVRTTTDNKTILGFWSEKGLGDAKTSATFDGRIALGKSYQLGIRVRANGTRVEFLLDGKPMATVSDFSGVKRSLEPIPVSITLSPNVTASFGAMDVVEIAEESTLLPLTAEKNPDISKLTEGLIVGSFEVVWTEVKTDKSGAITYTFQPNGIVLKGAAQIGSWKVAGEKVLVTFFDSQRGSAVVTPSDRANFIGIHSWPNGDRSRWVGKRAE